MRHTFPFFLVFPFVAACSSLVDVDRTRLEEPDYCDTDDECDDGLYCNGAERCIGRSCNRGTTPCDDQVPCTVDRCDEQGKTPDCTHEPADERCTQDPVEQICDVVDGCRPVAGGS